MTYTFPCNLTAENDLWIRLYMMLDGWSNVHNEPIVCVSVNTPEGESYLTETVDTSCHSHTAEYLEEVAMSAVTSTEQRLVVKWALSSQTMHLIW